MPQTFWHPKKLTHVEVLFDDSPRQQFVANMPTIGTETELFMRTSDMKDAGAVAQAIFQTDNFGDRISQEATAGLIEFMTAPHTSLGKLGQDHRDLLVRGANWAKANNLRILPISFEPLAFAAEPNWDRPFTRHQADEKYGQGMVRLVSTASLQINLRITDGNAMLYAHEGWRRALPLLIALTANSPFHQGLPTGTLAFRFVGRGVFINGGPLPEAIPLNMPWSEYLRRQIALTQIGDAYPIPCANNVSLRIKVERGCLELAALEVVGNLDEYLAICDLCRRVTFLLLVRYAEGRDIPDFLGATDDMALRTGMVEAVKKGRNGKTYTSELKPIPIQKALTAMIDWAATAPEDATHSWSKTQATLANILDHGAPAERLMRRFNQLHPDCPDRYRGCAECVQAVRTVCAELSNQFHAQFA